MATEPKQRLTIQEYLTLERQSETKSDYLDGEMFAMSGASREHNLVCGDIFGSLLVQLRGSGCEVYASDMRVRTPDDLLTYPDVVVVCGERLFDDSEVDTLLNPILIAEVLSPSTEAYDRLTKLEHYRTVPSLAEILLVAQGHPRVEHWVRQGDGRWIVEDVQDLEATVELPSIGCTLPLKRVYERALGSLIPST
ncbi:MAG TPA: Uma2 family endonuclease [Thermoanaerobaculia bacterium]|jgi:Uma2 family endonuclease|nr:Uma2 family endonuclease [Thermoanaerobaculia bacterium]